MLAVLHVFWLDDVTDYQWLETHCSVIYSYPRKKNEEFRTSHTKELLTNTGLLLPLVELHKYLDIGLKWKEWGMHTELWWRNILGNVCLEDSVLDRRVTLTWLLGCESGKVQKHVQWWALLLTLWLQKPTSQSTAWCWENWKSNDVIIQERAK